MADNTELNTGTGGDTIATDDIANVKHQRVKIEYGEDGSATDVSDTNPLPIDDAGGSLTVDNGGTFAVQADSVTPGVGATNLGKAEDAVHSSGDVGVMALGVRTDAPASTVADGDYAPLLLSEEGALWTENLPSEIEAGNSSTATLIADAVFTGTGVDLLDHQAITVMIDASHDSATDGMQFQFSSDNVNWDVSFDFTYTTNGGRTFQFGIYAQYFRVVYTNGGTGQTHFRCQTLLHHETTLTTIHRLVDDTSPDRSAEIVKSVIIAQAAGSGDFVPVQATASGNFKMSIEEVDGAIAGGGTEAAALRVTMANDSTGLLPVSDNGGSLTVDAPTGTPVNVQIGDGTDQALVTPLSNGFSNPTALETGAFGMVWNGSTWDKAHSAGSASDGIATDSLGYQFVVGCTMGFNGTTWDRLRSTIANGLDVDVTRLPAGTNLIGDVGIGVRTSGGTTLYKNIDVDESEDQVKGTAGQVYWIHAMNLSASVLFLKIYNATAASVIVGTTVPDLTFPIPTQGDTNGAGFTLSIPNGIAFGTAITVAATTGIADNDSGAPGANTVVLNMGYA